MKRTDEGCLDFPLQILMAERGKEGGDGGVNFLPPDQLGVTFTAGSFERVGL